MSLPPALDQAIVHYGPELNGIARHYGLDGVTLLRKLATGESGGRANAVSSAGARSWFQFMPGTRAAVIQKFGLDPWRSPAEAVQAAILHLKGQITGHAGLEGYNPGGGQAYVKYILGQHVGGAPSHSYGIGAAPSLTSTHTTPAHENVDAAILDSLLAPHQPGHLLKSIMGRLDSGQYTTPAHTSTVTQPGQPTAPVGAIPGGVTLDPHADRPGVRTNPGLLQWLGTWAGQVGGLHIGTGTNHNEFVAGRPGVQSDHWTGNAVDIPAAGRRGDQIAYTALRQLGVGDKQARLFVQNGGIYNVTRGGQRYQVIWKTNEGGNHFNHVHIGRRPA